MFLHTFKKNGKREKKRKSARTEKGKRDALVSSSSAIAPVQLVRDENGHITSDVHARKGIISTAYV